MTFEQELINAIRNGCPICGSDVFNVLSDEEVGYLVRVIASSGNAELDYYDSQCYSSHDKAICCQECGEDLWDRKGWIPELAEIMEGNKDG